MDHVRQRRRSSPRGPLDFIREIVAEDRRAGKHGGRVHTRFPPEPNGYLHIGHAKSICLNFGVAAEFGGLCNLRFDDTNPAKEDVEYVESIQEDVRWLGFDWDDRMFYASDYFEQMYALRGAADRRRQGLRRQPDGRRDPRVPRHADRARAQQPVPRRGRSTENLDLFRRMRAGEFPDGAHVLRAKIDMASPNINMRDPTLYRIRHATHHRTGDAWCIYPTYDYAHPISDAIEGITHSLCTLEFEDHRPLYDWVVEHIRARRALTSRPQQIEFARLNLNYTVMSKRKLLALVEQKLRRRLGRSADADDRRHPAPRLHAGGDPRLLRADRRGQEGERHRRRAARAHRARGSEPPRAARAGGAAAAEGRHRELPGRIASSSSTAVNNPEDASAGTRPLPFSRELYIERDDFMESAAEEVLPAVARHRGAAALRLHPQVRARRQGRRRARSTELRCTDDPDSLDGATATRRVKGTIHWVSAAHAVDAEVRLYDRLFTSEDPGDGGRDPLDRPEPAARSSG